MITTFPSTAISWYFIAILAGSALMASPIAASENSDGQRVSDTWQMLASGDSIYFDLGAALIDDVASQTLQRHIAKLRATPELHIVVIAHTNDLSSSSFELAKGQERLDAVRKRLEEAKISPRRIRTENHGSESPFTLLCADEDCRSKNRRVDFLFHR